MGHLRLSQTRRLNWFSEHPGLGGWPHSPSPRSKSTSKEACGLSPQGFFLLPPFLSPLGFFLLSFVYNRHFLKGSDISSLLQALGINRDQHGLGPALLIWEGHERDLRSGK